MKNFTPFTKKLEKLPPDPRWFALSVKSSGELIDTTLAVGYAHANKIFEALHGKKFSESVYSLHTFTPAGSDPWIEDNFS